MPPAEENISALPTSAVGALGARVPTRASRAPAINNTDGCVCGVCVRGSGQLGKGSVGEMLVVMEGFVMFDGW